VKLVETIAECRAALDPLRRAGRRIGFVPTMGYLHEGHLSLVDRARRDGDDVVLSIFVNPLQFSPHEDYERYPRDRRRDLALAEDREVDLIFAPGLEEMLPARPLTKVTISQLTDRYEGAVRGPAHFDGVLTIVAKLFHIVEPGFAVFGQKDAQQAAAVRRMVRDLDFPVEIVVAPTVREPDGLACSSRNAYLSPDERREALAISRALFLGAELARAGERDAARIESVMRQELSRSPAIVVEYAAIVDPETFAPLERVSAASLAVVAGRVAGTRLIDNAPLLSDGD
jgi:pantoate--beta-alanine ligase